MSSTPRSQLPRGPRPLPHHVKVERWVCQLLTHEYLELSSLLICPQGLFYRSYKEDILDTSLAPSAEAPEQLIAEVTREGLYDMLPEGLFHEVRVGSSTIDTEESVQELERHRREEQEARQFFLPLEQEFYRQKIYLEHQEHQVFQPLTPDSEAFAFLEKVWNVPVDLSVLQRLVLVYLGPHLHHISGNLTLIRQCFELILQVPVRITSAYRASTVLAEQDTCRLGKMTLGDRSIIGNTLEDSWPYRLITLGSLSGEQLLSFLTDTALDHLVHFLAGHLFALGTDCAVHLEVASAIRPFMLQKEVSFAGRLGYTTYLT